MPNVNGMGTTWNLPNYAGELFTASKTKTPFLSMIGGLSGGLKTKNDEFSTGVLYEHDDASQPSISESASATAPAPTAITRTQGTNVTQIFQETISLSYAKMANSGKLEGLNSAGQKANPASEKDFQITKKLEKIARDVEYTFLCGRYQKATGSDVPNKTRGMIELCETGTTIDAAGAVLSGSILKALYKLMADNGANFDNMVLYTNSYLKQIITDIYEKQLGYNVAAARNVGGMNITEIENDFFKFGIAYDPFMPSDTLLIADIAHVAPVFQEVPGKGVLFVEELAKKGAAEDCQIYGQIGLDHGPAHLHGTITGLKVE